jgi:Spy/CpxP family protein refolding chaperone
VRRWWVVLALLLSLGVNIGILATLAVHRWRSPPPPAERLRPDVVHRIARLADHLELEGEERQRFVEIQRRFFETTVRHTRGLARLRMQLRRELVKPEPDSGRVEVLVEELGRNYEGLEGSMAEAILESRRLLDAEQQRKYLRVLSRLRARMMEQRQPRRQVPQGPSERRRRTPVPSD